MRKTLVILALALAMAGIVFGVVAYARLPRTVTLAVGPEGRETHRYAMAIADAARAARERIRFTIVTTGGAAESAQLLDQRKVDLAIVRSDYEWPESGQTILVNTKRTVLVIAPQPRRGGIQTFANLKGKRIGVVRLTDPNVPLVQRILAASDIGEKDVTLSEVDIGEAADQLIANRLDAIIAVVVATAPNVTDAVADMVRRVPGGIRLIPIDGAPGIAERLVGLEAVELRAGAFGAGRPQEELTTLAISYRTVAHQRMPEAKAGQIAKTLYDLRSRLNRQVPIAFTSEPPSATSGPRLPIHPGAAAHFEGETKTFFERYGEMIFAGLWGTSILGSGLAGLFAWITRQRHREGSALIEEITRLTRALRTASPEERGRIEARGDEIVATLAHLRQHGQISEATADAAGIALDHFRSVAGG